MPQVPLAQFHHDTQRWIQNLASKAYQKDKTQQIIIKCGDDPCVDTDRLAAFVDVDGDHIFELSDAQSFYKEAKNSDLCAHHLAAVFINTQSRYGGVSFKVSEGLKTKGDEVLGLDAYKMLQVGTSKLLTSNQTLGTDQCGLIALTSALYPRTKSAKHSFCHIGGLHTEIGPSRIKIVTHENSGVPQTSFPQDSLQAKRKEERRPLQTSPKNVVYHSNLFGPLDPDKPYKDMQQVIRCAIRGFEFKILNSQMPAVVTESIGDNNDSEKPETELKTILVTGFTDWENSRGLIINPTGRLIQNPKRIEKAIRDAFPNQTITIVDASSELPYLHRPPLESYTPPTAAIHFNLIVTLPNGQQFRIIGGNHRVTGFKSKDHEKWLEIYKPDFCLMFGTTGVSNLSPILHRQTGTHPDYCTVHSNQSLDTSLIEEGARLLSKN